MSDICVATPIDSVESTDSKNFIYPSRIGNYNVIQLSIDTAGLNVSNKIEYARENLIVQFLKTTCDKILFLDSDIIVDPDDLLPLIKSDQYVAFALYPYRPFWSGEKRLPQYPTISSRLPQGGLGCCGIHRDTFALLDRTYFGRHGRITFWKNEDWNFFRNCQRYDIDTIVYPNIQVGHQDRLTDIIYYFNHDKTEIIKWPAKL